MAFSRRMINPIPTTTLRKPEEASVLPGNPKAQTRQVLNPLTRGKQRGPGQANLGPRRYYSKRLIGPSRTNP